MLITVIVPIYNTEKYLWKCIESILAQTYTNFELLLVNDGSTDRSGEICDNYAKKDSRIRVFHKENGGVSSARNIGLDNAKGEWVCFVDSDDAITMTSFEQYKNNISDCHDLIISRYQKIKITGEIIKSETQDDTLVTLLDFFKEMFFGKHLGYQGYIWNKIFRYNVIKEHNLRFNEDIHFNEDRLFIIQFASVSKKIIKYTNNITYNHVLNPNGTMESLKKAYNKKFITDFDAFMLMKRIIDKTGYGNQLHNEIRNAICYSYNWNLKLMLQFGKYNLNNHCHMIYGMIKSGAIILYLKIAVRQLLKLFYHHKSIKQV